MTARRSGNIGQTALTQPRHVRPAIRQYAVITVMACAFLGSEAARGQCSVNDPNTLVVNNDLSANCCQPPCAGTPADPYCDIEDAVSNSTDGDTVCVEPGTYSPSGGQVNFGTHKIELRSTGGRDVTTILGGLRIVGGGQGPETLVEGFTITHTSGNGYGVRCANTHPEIRGNLITGNTDNGIRLENSDALVADNIISGNQDSGISLDGSAALIKDNVISNNEANGGGGISINEGNPTIIDNEISNNQAIYRRWDQHQLGQYEDCALPDRGKQS